MKDFNEKAQNQFYLSTRSIVTWAREFFHMEAAGGIVMLFAAILALLVANSGLYDYYNYILNSVQFLIGFEGSAKDGFVFEIEKSILLWINDGLMAVFFFLVGLEIKREFKEGELSSPARALLPGLAAVGGIAMPALIFCLINMHEPANLRGWAIPAATDIAFALGVLSLVGSRAPVALKVILTAIAVIDDLAAILIIALFYSHKIMLTPLLFAAVALAVLVVINLRGVVRIGPYILLGLVLWVAVLNAGIHATLAGVIAAFCIPLRAPNNPAYSPCKRIEHDLHPWVAFGVLPVFAFANAGVPFTGMGLDILVDPVTLGIVLGLFFGKQIGIFTVMWACIKVGLAPMPKKTNWVQLYAVSLLCGIGFTMSLFIGGLAYESLEMQASVRLGVLLGSAISAVLGFVLLRYGPSRMGERQPHNFDKEPLPNDN